MQTPRLVLTPKPESLQGRFEARMRDSGWQDGTLAFSVGGAKYIHQRVQSLFEGFLELCPESGFFVVSYYDSGVLIERTEINWREAADTMNRLIKEGRGSVSVRKAQKP